MLDTSDRQESMERWLRSRVTPFFEPRTEHEFERLQHALQRFGLRCRLETADAEEAVAGEWKQMRLLCDYTIPKSRAGFVNVSVTNTVRHEAVPPSSSKI